MRLTVCNKHFIIIIIIRLRLDCNSTALRPFDDHITTVSAGQRPVMCDVTVTLLTLFDKQSNGRRNEVVTNFLWETTQSAFASGPSKTRRKKHKPTEAGAYKLDVF